MGKYEYVLTHDCLNNIANELAEANRLKRLEIELKYTSRDDVTYTHPSGAELGYNKPTKEELEDKAWTLRNTKY